MAAPQSAIALGWKGFVPCDGTWLGVNCSGTDVVGLTLPSQGLLGTLPAELVNLNNTLTNLDLSSNPRLSGTIPSWIGSFKRLQHLDLQKCDFSGPIPETIGELKNLTFFQVTDNRLTGPLPASIGNLANLVWLDIGNNQIEGPLPSTIANMSSLQHFHGWNNSITGSIPPLFGSLPLVHLLLDNNQFSGGIPGDLGNITTLKILRISNNPLGQPTPATIPPTFQNLVNLVSLEMSNCRLGGEVPTFENLTQLQNLDLSFNALTGQVSSAFGTKLLNLTSIHMNDNSIGGNLSESLGNLKSLVELDLSNNKGLIGTIPNNLGGPTQTQLRVVDLSGCTFTDGGEGLLKTDEAVAVLSGNLLCQERGPYVKLCTNKRPSRVTADVAPCTRNCGNDLAPSPDQDCICKSFLIIVLKLFGTPYPAEDFFTVVNPKVFRDTVVSEINNALGTTWDITQVQIPSSEVAGNSQLVVSLQFFPSAGSNSLTPQEVQKLTSAFKDKIKLGYGPAMVLESRSPKFGGTEGDGGFDAWKIGVIVAVLLVLVVALTVCLTLWCRKTISKPSPQTESKTIGSSTGGAASGATSFDPVIGRKGPQQFSFAELFTATNRFSESSMLGKGGYGNVYKGVLPNGMEIAVKRASEDSLQGIAEFKVEIDILSQVYHKNLIRLLGYCHEDNEQMLVYEYMPNGNLKEQIHQKPVGPLSFETRVNIALGSARGLAYLHHQVSPQIIHRDIKTTNILLGENWEPKVADFGLSKETQEGTMSSMKSKVKGTFGYMDPEYQMTMRVTEKSDVFSFGVVLLELFTAMPPVQKAGKHIIREVKGGLLRGGPASIVDPALQGNYNAEALVRVVAIALQCSEPVPAARPDMSAVVRELESIAQYLWKMTRGDGQLGGGSSYPPSPRMPGGLDSTAGATAANAQLSEAMNTSTGNTMDVHTNPHHQPPSFDISNPSFHYSGEATSLQVGR